MAVSSDREHVRPSDGRKVEPRASVRQVPLHAIRVPNPGTQARESVRQSPAKNK